MNLNEKPSDQSNDIQDKEKQQPVRPQLSYLRTAWTSSEIYRATLKTLEPDQQEDPLTSKDDATFKLQLPRISIPEDIDQDEIVGQVFQMILVANVLCWCESILTTVIVLYTTDDWWRHAILPVYIVWWSIMILVLQHNTEYVYQYINWTQSSTVIMAASHSVMLHNPYYVLAFLPWVSFLLYTFARRILIAHEASSKRLKQHLQSEQEKIQTKIDESMNEYRDHQLTFMKTVSQEIQDVALMVITTLEQFSPTAILFNTHELLSACSLAIPTASVFAINTTIRQVCHVSSHLHLLSRLVWQAWPRTNSNLIDNTLPELVTNEFDIGELLQNIGDAMAGVAAKLDVEFVIYHCENNLHHTMVIGDEGAIRHALINHLRNILECCTPGACIEVGLNVSTITDSDNLNITFQITHTASPAIRNSSAALLPNANLTAQLLSYIHATTTVETHKNQTKFEFAFELESGREENRKLFISKETILLKNHYANIKFSNEPSLKELTKFIGNLKGLKIVLHAREKSSFAKHLTGCLASWNTDISHVPVVQRPQFQQHDDTGSETDVSTTSSTASVMPPRSNTSAATTPPVPSPAIEEEHIHSIPPSFILIDDDVLTLEGKLNEFRAQPPASANVLHVKRHHQHKKSNLYQNFFHQGTTAIIHFTSLSNYKAVRDTIQCFTFLPNRDPFSMPRVVVVPKPAGPRRFLTALHTAWNNAVVEPHFSAIATSPSSPVPPIVSLLVQRELAANSPNSNSAVTSPSQEGNNRSSPGAANDTSSTTTRRRPLSGIFSPPSDNNSHYFAAHHQQQQQTASSPRRKSNTDQPMDYLTAKPTGSPNNPNLSPREIVTNVAEDMCDQKANSPNASPAVQEQKNDEVKEKKMSRAMSNFKLHKKKKKDKRTPFGNVVSPPINVLIVEDNIINQAILSVWMKKHQIKFSVASNGLEAVDKWKSGKFHLILMDIQLPVMNGIEATKTIRSIEKEQKIGVLPMSSSFLRQQQAVAAAAANTIMNEQQEEDLPPMLSEEDKRVTPSIFRSPVIIVALTASSLESDRHAALAAGCNDFLTKPVSLEWLEKKIIEWGCMQALIDFEGWRRWKKTAEPKKPSTPKVTTPTATEEMEAEKKRIEEISKSPNRTGIMLPGVGNLVKSRRLSSVDRHTLKASKSDSDTQSANQVQLRPSSSASTASSRSKKDCDEEDSNSLKKAIRSKGQQMSIKLCF
ncbi:Putative Osomolarity two-component system, response regulator SSK1 [Rhizopus microsporus]|nr:Putative Osomolarity two-component system, response regulator SSK1 [Rhizopus microsporus]